MSIGVFCIDLSLIPSNGFRLICHLDSDTSAGIALVKQNYWMSSRSEEAAASIYAEGRGFLRSFRTLGNMSVRQGRHMFLMKPKFHVP